MPKGQLSLDLLQNVPLFQDLSKKELQRLAGEFRERPFNAGEDIVVQGEQAGGFYVILRGRVKVIVDGRTRATLGPGGSFGEVALIDRRPRSATVRAETQALLVSLSSASFLSVLQENWSITKKVMAGLCSRIRSLDQDAM